MDDDADEHAPPEQTGNPNAAPVQPPEEPMPTVVSVPEDDPPIWRLPVEPPGV